MFPGSTPTHTPSSNSSDKEKDRVSGRKRLSTAKFQPPDRPPAYKDWVPDTKHHVCMVCQREKFTMVRGDFFRHRFPYFRVLNIFYVLNE